MPENRRELVGKGGIYREELCNWYCILCNFLEGGKLSFFCFVDYINRRFNSLSGENKYNDKNGGIHCLS